MTTMRRLTLCLSLATAVARGQEFSGTGGFVSGNELLGWCTMLLRTVDTRAPTDEIEMIEGGKCSGYLMAIFDAHEVWSHVGMINNRRHCPPQQGLISGQLARIVVNYLRAHPESLHFNAVGAVANSYSQAFPCPPSSP